MYLCKAFFCKATSRAINRMSALSTKCTQHRRKRQPEREPRLEFGKDAKAGALSQDSRRSTCLVSDRIASLEIVRVHSERPVHIMIAITMVLSFGR